MALQFKRGTNLERLQTVLAAGEPFYVTDWDTYGITPFYIGDGVKFGGIAAADVTNFNDLNDVNILNPGAGQIIKWNTPNGRWENSDNLKLNGTVEFQTDKFILGADGKVGINKAIPQWPLHVGGSIVSDSIGTGDIQAVNLTLSGNLSAGNISFTGNTAFDTNTLVIDALNNRVGIKYSNPQYELHVNGTIVGVGIGTTSLSATTANMVTANITGITTTGGLVVDTDTLVVDTTEKQVGIRTLTPDYDLDVNGDARIVQQLTVDGALAVADGALFVDNINKRVGVNNATPLFPLHVTGAIVSSNLGTGTLTATSATINGNLTSTSINTGPITTTGNIIVGGDLTVNGTTTTINSTVTTIDDPMITLGGDTDPISDDFKDRGVEFRYYAGGAAKKGFFGFDRSADAFSYYNEGTNTGEIYAGTIGNAKFANLQLAGSATGSNIRFNTDQTGTPTLNATLTAIRGDSPSATINWDELNDWWNFGQRVWVQNKIHAQGDIETETNVVATGDITAGGQGNFKGIQFDLVDQATADIGMLRWDTDIDTLTFKLNDQVTSYIGQQTTIKVQADEINSDPIPKGRVVYPFNSTIDNLALKIRKLPLNSSFAKTKPLGVTAEDFVHGQIGIVVNKGYVRGLDTTGLGIKGDVIYMGADGSLTSTIPTYPSYELKVGYLVRNDATDGIIYVDMKSPVGINDIYGVAVAGVQNQDILEYQSGEFVNVPGPNAKSVATLTGPTATLTLTNSRDYSTLKLIIQTKRGTDYRSVEVLVCKDQAVFYADLTADSGTPVYTDVAIERDVNDDVKITFSGLDNIVATTATVVKTTQIV